MHEYEEIDPLWHLNSDLTVEQASALLAGYEPSEVDQLDEDYEHSNMHRAFPRMLPARNALRNAINAGKLRATIRHQAQVGYVGKDDIEFPSGDQGRFSGYALTWSGKVMDREAEIFYQAAIDWRATTIAVDDLKAWLASRGLKTGFFAVSTPDAPDYLNPQHPRYAAKLATAVRAWLAVNDPGNKSPKQALTKWLREHAAEFGFTDEEGKPNETGIEEMAKVANWQPTGGAPRTPNE